MSFASEPGRDDGNLPPLNVVIPDDARELDRDVLAYRRELRAQRRRKRLARLARPGLGGPAAIVPLIAACLALCLVGGALLSVVTMTPATEPSGGPQVSAQPTSTVLTTLPAGNVTELDGLVVPVRSLVSSAIALVPADCGCDPALRRLADQAIAADVGLYFIGTGKAIPQLAALTAKDGDGAAVGAEDPAGVLSTAYHHPAGLTVLLVFSDATAEVSRNLTGDFQLAGTLDELKGAGRAR